MTGIDDYKFGRKNNWRRSVWNEISSRVPNRRDALVIYLAGAQDLDRAVACSKGFRSENLIAVDQDKSVVSHLRSGGKIAIQGNLLHVVACWPQSCPISVLFADLCCGLTDQTARLLECVAGSPGLSTDAVVMMNLQRGRERGSNTHNFMRLESNTIHRGQRLILWLAIQFSLPLFMEVQGVPSKQEMRALYATLRRDMDPEYFSYRSTVTMDSVVFNKPTPHAMAPDMSHYLSDADQSTLRNRIRAALAVRTMRSSGTLGPAPLR